MDSGRDDCNNDLMANSNNTKDILSIKIKLLKEEWNKKLKCLFLL
jgi:hypothetical protein